MEASNSVNHVVLMGGPESGEDLLAIVLDDGEAVPLFDSVEEADEFLASTTDLESSWFSIEIAPGELAFLLEAQGEEVRYVALSPPPEDLRGGMEVQIIERESLVQMLRLQSQEAKSPPERPGLLRRLFGRGPKSL